MSERLHAAAIGFALVDEKIIGPDVELPPADFDSVQEFLSQQQQVYVSAGGSVANTMAAFSGSSEHAARLYYRVAEDERGDIFRDETSAALGEPQVSNSGRTGFCVISIGVDGAILDETNLYGVAPEVEVPRAEMSSTTNQLVVANLNSLRTPRISEQVDDLLRKTLDRRVGQFAFRLSGAHALLATQADVASVVGQLPRTPDIIFANAPEIENMTGSSEPDGLHRAFPNTRLLVVTNGSEPTTVRFEDTVTTIPTQAVRNVVDTTGAGDHLMGVTLARLLEKTPQTWTADDVRRAVSLGTTAAARVIRTTRSRLNFAGEA